MKNSKIAILSSGLFVFGLVANAQTYGPPRDDPYYRDDRNGGGQYRDDDYRQRRDNRYGSRQGGSLIGQVLSDIDRAARQSWVDNHERKHFYEASRKLQEFEERWARGNWDNGKLDKAIENLQHLAESDQVRGREREVLYRDLNELRQFRSGRGRNSSWR